MDQKPPSSWPDVSYVPESYVHPLEKRPGKLFFDTCKTIPVVDLEGYHDRTHVVQDVLKATKEFGFFQVINHGVSKKLMDDTMAVFKEFHAMRPEDKASECSKDPNRSCKFYTSSENFSKEEFHYWRDALTHPCHSLEEYMQFWPRKPIRYRGGLGGDPVLLVNHYPPCPDPSLTLGLAKHRDPSLITILFQEQNGLQVCKNDEWILVEPVPHAFVINVGYVLQIISNGELKGAEHRAVTNSSVPRTSAAFFIYPSKDDLIEPAKALTNADNPPLYGSMQFKEFQRNYLSYAANAEKVQKFISST
nr:hyoscyamine 6-dioxygenase-like isoform X2 [Quercus suber]